MCRKRELFRIWKQSWNEEVRTRSCEVKKYAKRVVCVAMYQKAREAVEKIDSCFGGRELFRIANKELGRRKMLLGLINLKMKVGWSH